MLLLKENGGVIQTVAFNSYLNIEKHQKRETVMHAIYKEVADSLGLVWYDKSELDSLNKQQKETFYENRTQITLLAQERAKKIENMPPAVNVSDFIDHVDYLVNYIGIDHVGISSDFDGGGGIEGWSDASETTNVTAELVKRSYSEKDIEKLWGANLLRVLDQVQTIATTL